MGIVLYSASLFITWFFYPSTHNVQMQSYVSFMIVSHLFQHKNLGKLSIKATNTANVYIFYSLDQCMFGCIFCLFMFYHNLFGKRICKPSNFEETITFYRCIPVCLWYTHTHKLYHVHCTAHTSHVTVVNHISILCKAQLCYKFCNLWFF